MKYSLHTILFLMIAFSLEALGSNSSNSHSKIQSIIDGQKKIYQEWIPAFISKVEHYETRFGVELKSLCKAANFESWHEGLLSPDEIQLLSYCAAYEASQVVISSIPEEKLRHETFIKNFNGSIDQLEHNVILNSRLLNDINIASKLFDTLEFLPSIKNSKKYKNYHTPYTQKNIEQVEKSNKRDHRNFGRTEWELYTVFATYCLRDDFNKYFKRALDTKRLKEIDKNLAPKDENGHILRIGDFDQNRYFLASDSKQLYIGLAEVAETSYCYVASPNIQAITLHWLATNHLKHHNILHSVMKANDISVHRIDIETKFAPTNNAIYYNAYFPWKKNGENVFPVKTYFASGISANQPKQPGMIYYSKKH